VAFEPAGLCWCLAAEACERTAVGYLLVHGKRTLASNPHRGRMFDSEVQFAVPDSED
jgi:hypothetical protein